MSSEGLARTFVGVPLRDQASEAALRLAARLRRALGDDAAVKWEPRDNVHATLHFLGETDRAALGEIEAALQAVARAHAPFELSLGPPAWFPGRSGPRVFVLAVAEGSRELALLQRDVGAALAPLGFPPDDRPFRAHVTVGRVRRNRKLAAARADQACAAAATGAAGARMPVAGFVLFESTLSPTGAAYAPLATIPLRGPG